jgi:hypothetical protein
VDPIIRLYTPAVIISSLGGLSCTSPSAALFLERFGKDDSSSLISEEVNVSIRIGDDSSLLLKTNVTLQFLFVDRIQLEVETGVLVSSNKPFNITVHIIGISVSSLVEHAALLSCWIGPYEAESTFVLPSGHIRCEFGVLESSNLIAGKYPVFLTLDSIKMISTSSSSPLITVINSPIITSVNVVFSNDMDKQEVTEVIIQGFGFTGQLNIPQCVYSMMSSSTSDIEKVETTLLSDSFLSCSSPSVNFMASLIVSQMGKTFVSIEIDNGLIRSDPFVFFFGDLAPKFSHDLQLGQNILKVEDQEDPYASLFVIGAECFKTLMI